MYADTHPELRAHLVTITTASGTTELMPRDRWEAVAAERDEYRRVLAMISAWRVTAADDLELLDRLLRRVGETPDSGRAIAHVISWARGEHP